MGGWVLLRKIILQGFSVFVNVILKRFLTTAPSDSFFSIILGWAPPIFTQGSPRGFLRFVQGFFRVHLGFLNIVFFRGQFMFL